MMNIKVSRSYQHFIVANYVQYAINEFIKKENIQYAYVIGFSIKTFTKGTYTVSKRMLESIKQHIADYINTYFNKYEHKVLFMSNNGSFFVLLKTDAKITKLLGTMYKNNYKKVRNSSDPLYQFSTFKVNPYEFQTFQIIPKINLIVGLYGVHDNDIFNLIYNIESMVE
jgi:hypothetical protein